MKPSRRHAPQPRAETNEPGVVDCLVIGAGPAGLTAAVYLARYLRKVLVFDDGHSRARLIPESHNYPGFSGIHGTDLLKTLRHQARRYGATIEHGHVDTLAKQDEDHFVARIGEREIRARRVLLASGIIDESPALPGLRDAIYHGALRFCPICDGYEAMDRRIGVLGRYETAWKKALFLRTYSRDIVLLSTDDPSALDGEIARALTEAGIPIPRQVVRDVERNGDAITAVLADGETCEVDVLYPAMGCDVRSRLGNTLGAKHNEEGCLIVDDHQRTSVPGLFAAGDVVSDLHQISVATGHAAIAATTIHNSLPRNYR
jgi:thioredoxin reductase (NADPH)